MTRLYYNIVKAEKKKEHTFAIYVSEDSSSLTRSEADSTWDQVKECLGEQDKDCQWHRCVINTKNIINILENLNCERSHELRLEGDTTLKY